MMALTAACENDDPSPNPNPNPNPNPMAVKEFSEYDDIFKVEPESNVKAELKGAEIFAAPSQIKEVALIFVDVELRFTEISSTRKIKSEKR